MHVRDLLELARPGASGRSLDLPGMRATREFDSLLLNREAPEPAPGYRYELPVPGTCVVPQAGLRISARIDDAVAIAAPAERKTAALIADAIPAILTVRSRLPADTYGGPGHRKVKKMLIDARIPLHLRAVLPMVCIGNAVAWVPGFLPAKMFRASPGGRRCVILMAEQLATVGAV